MSLVAFTNSEEYQVSWEYDFLNNVVKVDPRIVQDGTVYTLTNQVNDAITWNFVNTHNLVEVDSLPLWLDCYPNGIMLGPPGTEEVTTYFTEVKKRYFICTIGGPGSSHCDSGQKLVVNTVASPIEPDNCKSLKKRACKKNAEESGECSYEKKKGYTCTHKGKKNKKKCKEFNYDDKSVKNEDGCKNEKNVKGKKICKVKKAKIGYCFTTSG